MTPGPDGENAAAGLPSHDIDELKQSLIDVWHGFEQSVINVRKYETFSIYFNSIFKVMNKCIVAQFLLRHGVHTYS